MATDATHPEKNAPKPKKQEGWLGIGFVSVCCVVFLWWWFSLPATLEPVGIPGLVVRAVAEAEEQKRSDDLLTDLDLFELAMLRLRHVGVPEAEPIADKITRVEMQDRFWQEAALTTFNQASGDFSPALSLCEKIRDPKRKAAAKEAVVIELALLGMPDAALQLSENQPKLRCRLAKIFSESGSADKAEALLKEFPDFQGLTPEQQVDLTWTNLWLRKWDVVEKLLPTLMPDRQRELWEDYFRATRLERPDQAAALLGKLPVELREAMRLEAAAQLGSNLVEPKALVAEYFAKANAGTSAALWLEYAEAAWKLQQSEPLTWQAALEKAAGLLPSLSVQEQATAQSRMASLFLDAADLGEGKRWLQEAFAASQNVSDPLARFASLTSLYEQAFRSSQPDLANQLLLSLDNTVSSIPPPGPEASSYINALFRDGFWERAVQLMQSQPERMPAYLAELMTRLVESTAVDFGLSQDQSMQDYRVIAANQGEEAAAIAAMRLGKSYARARAWLSIAKGLSKPTPVAEAK
jgi:hypothetical protein